MKYLIILPLMFLNGCAGFQGVADDIEKIETNNAITIKVDKDALDKDTNLNISVDIINKEEKK